MKTSDAVSPIATVQVATSLVGFFLVYSLLGAADFYLLFKFARKGPVDTRPQGARRPRGSKVGRRQCWKPSGS